MDSPEPFAVHDCSLVRLATGRSCVNLRELRDGVQSVSDGAIEHHMMHCVLEDHFSLYEFPNDLARWCWSALGDHALGERLALVDPYRYESLGQVRTAIVEILDDRLWRLERIPWCRPGLELHWIESRLISYDTGERISTHAALAEAIRQMSPRSLFYHVHEARRRNRPPSDDFSLWLESIGVEQQVVARLRAIDFYFLNLRQLRDELLAVFQQWLMDPSVVKGVGR